ncbi:homoserine O-acetyltransferase/O-succinyltransferase family protein [Holzapfeliella sp. JNUCC 80]
MSVNACNGFLKQNREWVNTKMEDPIKLVILNLMPNKKETERQFLDLLDELNTEITVQFIYPKTHHSKHTRQQDLEKYYATFDEIKNKKVDGLIITGAPIEKLAFNQVDYLAELKQIRDWAKENVKQTVNECWAAQAALYQDFGIEKKPLENKLFGIYQANYIDSTHPLNCNIENFNMPQSRHTESIIDDELPEGLKVIASSQNAGPFILHANEGNQLYISGHPEYQTNTLHDEYLRDLNKQQKIQKPINYYDKQYPKNTWHKSSRQFYQNWVDLIEENSKVNV